MIPRQEAGKETMATQIPLKGFSVLAAVLVAVLMVFVVVAGVVGAAPAAPASTPVGSWSYGAARSVSVGPVQGADGWTYQGTATFGYTVTSYLNNTSKSDFELTVHRTVGASFLVKFCLPSCSSPTNWVNLSYRAYQTTVAFTNFTTQGTVNESGQTVAAVALLNSSVKILENVTEVSDAFLPVDGWLGAHTLYLSGEISGRAMVNFTPALGLFPTDLVPGSSWSATSTFAATGSAVYSFYYHAYRQVKTTTVGPVSGLISFNANGSVTIEGSYASGSTVEFGGVSYPAVTLTVIGPFSVSEGVIFVPVVADVFGGSSLPWAGNASASTSVVQSNVDVKFVDGRLHVVASSLRYSTTSANPADTVATTVGSDLTPAAASSNPISTTVVQGEPETSEQAGSTQQCLTGGAGCPLPPAGTPPRSYLGAIVVVAAVATVGVLIAVGVVSRQRKLPPPAYPNAALYPPGANGAPRPARAPTPPAGPPPPEDDPLNHLW